MNISLQERHVREARQALEAAEAALALAKMRTAEPAAGSRILIRAVFPNGARKYDYLALRTEGSPEGWQSWYVTGREGKVFWDDILDLVKRADFEVIPLKFTF